MNNPSFLVCPDSLKGSLSSPEFCQIAEHVIKQHFPQSKVTTLPFADGGEGTAEALIHGVGGQLVECETVDALGVPCRASFGIAENGQRGFLDLASASGLAQIGNRRNGLAASSYGTGILLKKLLETEVEEIILGLGGSACTDGGTGLLVGLGAKFLDEFGQEIPLGTLGLLDLAAIDLSAVTPLLEGKSIRVACDVNAPLYGPNGAAYVFGPQKGIPLDKLMEADRSLYRLGEVVTRFTGIDETQVPGTGSAGGTGYTLLTLLEARLESGFDLVAEILNLNGTFADNTFDWVISGEGKVDQQTLGGKFLGRLGHLCKTHQKKLIAFTGARDEISREDLANLGITSLFTISPGPGDLRTSMEDGAKNLEQTLTEVVLLIKSTE